MLIGLLERDERPDAILFANTGGERPATYAYIERFSEWLAKEGFPAITWLRRTPTNGRYVYATLEEDCLVKGMLPSLAYGRKGCSWKYKREVMDKWCNNSGRCLAAWEQGEKVGRLIGYDADEQHRKGKREDDKYLYRYPLREWGWGRRDCEEAIAHAGLCVPPKSACFFCPGAKKHEVRQLADEEPELFARALAIERGARATGRLTQVKGLGRHWTWEAIAAADQAQAKLFDEPPQVPCECWD
jgi:hypothetical protein